MRRLLVALIFSLSVAMLSGCATMSKEECINANWRSLGYSDGARGVHYSYLDKRREACGEYAVVPDNDAYMSGWNEGIRGFCTSDRGYRYGVAGKAYNHICPADVEADFLTGWRQGIRRYCAPDNGLKLGLQGRGYSGACPPEMEPAFRLAYQRGRHVHQARINYRNAHQRLMREQREMREEKDPAKRRKDAHEVAQLQRQVEQLYFDMSAQEACITNDWFAIGRNDGASGYPSRATELARSCGGRYADRRGYNEGWRQGVVSYCTYESGLRVGRNNMPYHGICAGHAHRQFWRGYEEGRERYREYDRPEHRDVRRPAPVRVAPVARPAPEHRAPAREVNPDHRAWQPLRPVRQEKPQHTLQPQPEEKGSKRSQPEASKGRSTAEKGKADAGRQQPVKPLEGKDKKEQKEQKNRGKQALSDQEGERD
jgi:ribosome modulation factor